MRNKFPYYALADKGSHAEIITGLTFEEIHQKAKQKGVKIDRVWASEHAFYTGQPPIETYSTDKLLDEHLRQASDDPDAVDCHVCEWVDERE